MRVRHWGSRLALSLVALVSVLAVSAAATPTEPPPANETRTVDARDPDPCLSPAQYTATYGQAPTRTQQLATCTDLTYDAPPAHAATMTAQAFAAFEPGGANASVYPPHADRVSRGAIADAHATVVAIHPATRVQLDATTTRQYLAPTGTVRALVDYRVRGAFGPNRSLIGHRVQRVTVTIGDEEVATTTGTQTPALSYTTTRTGDQPLTVTATIAVTTAPNGTPANATTQTVTVSDTRSVWIHRLHPDAYTAQYPDGSRGLAVYQGQPWHGLTLTANGTHRVRGVWRYYTARDPRWERLRVARATGTSRLEQGVPALEVVAYPSRIGPRTMPVRDGPTLTAVWGVETATPAARLHENVSVGVVDDAYTRSYGLAVRSDATQLEAVRLHGIVRGVSAPLTSVTPTERPIRQPELSVRLTDRRAASATLVVTLTDPVTGAPIRPRRSNATRPIVADAPPGKLWVNGEPLTVGPNGTARRTLSEPGLYTVRFEPASWRATTPAYVAASDTVRWHPLSTVAGWVQLLETVLWGVIPIAVAWVAGRQIAHLLSRESPP